MKIRSATLEDIQTIIQYDKHITREELVNITSLGRVFVAEDNYEFAGWLRYGLFWDNTPFMNMIFLLTKYRGRGYGKELVEYWENAMKRAGYCSIMTSTASDEYAQHFYNHLGYKTVGGFTPVGDPLELILWKNI